MKIQGATTKTQGSQINIKKKSKIEPNCQGSTLLKCARKSHKHNQADVAVANKALA